MVEVKRMYLNTSILIRAASRGEPGYREARSFLAECCRVYLCVVSAVHRLEPWHRTTRKLVNSLLRKLGAEVVAIDLDEVVVEARSYIDRRGLSPRRILDVAHLIAAKKLGCRAVAAIDRFIARHAKHFGLLYLNHYTGCRDP